MGELGEFSDGVHEEIGALAVQLGVDRLVIVGDRAHAMLRGARQERSRADGPRGEESVLVPDCDAAAEMLRDLTGDDVVLVKGANVFGLWRVAEALLAGERSVGGAA
jgi:UDP-N-acetylmuramoyl-tripeptide--D-alanyl-D-alanine ligase